MTFGQNIEKVTLKQRIWASCRLLNRFFPLKEKLCLVCAKPDSNDSLPHYKCPTPDCKGLYCYECFTDLGKMCTICKTPADYGDLSDVSEVV